MPPLTYYWSVPHATLPYLFVPKQLRAVPCNAAAQGFPSATHPAWRDFFWSSIILHFIFFLILSSVALTPCWHTLLGRAPSWPDTCSYYHPSPLTPYTPHPLHSPEGTAPLTTRLAAPSTVTEYPFCAYVILSVGLTEQRSVPPLNRHGSADDTFGRSFPGNPAESEGHVYVKCWQPNKSVRVHVVDICPCWYSPKGQEPYEQVGSRTGDARTMYQVTVLTVSSVPPRAFCDT